MIKIKKRHLIFNSVEESQCNCSNNLFLSTSLCLVKYPNLSVHIGSVLEYNHIDNGGILNT